MQIPSERLEQALRILVSSLVWRLRTQGRSSARPGYAPQCKTRICPSVLNYSYEVHIIWKESDADWVMMIILLRRAHSSQTCSSSVLSRSTPFAPFLGGVWDRSTPVVTATAYHWQE